MAAFVSSRGIGVFLVLCRLEVRMFSHVLCQVEIQVCLLVLYQVDK